MQFVKKKEKYIFKRRRHRNCLEFQPFSAVFMTSSIDEAIDFSSLKLFTLIV